MIPLKAALGRISGLTLSILIHGAVAGLACVTLISVRGRGGGGGASGGGDGLSSSFFVGVREEGPRIDGDRESDKPAYGRVESEISSVEEFESTRVAEIPPFDPLTDIPVEASEPAPVPVPAEADYPGRSSNEARHARLPGSSSGASLAGAEAGSGASGGAHGAAGLGGGGREGTGDGSGAGVGDGSGAAQIFAPSPEYPAHARRKGIQGAVVVEISVLPDGTCSISRLVESSGCDELDQAAQAAVRRWKYKPLEREGQPCSSLERVRFVFRLTH
jgi:protein TonB